MNDYKNTYKYYEAIAGYTYNIIDIPFYLHFIKDYMNILDVGCGTGRVSIELASNRKHCIIDAIDISSKMLTIFKSNLLDNRYRKGSSINIYKMDMRDIKLNNKYDFLIFPFQSFQTITDKSDQLNVLIKVKSLLNEDGKIILSFFDPTSHLVTNKPITYISNIYNFSDRSRIIKLSKDTWIDFKKKLYYFTDYLLVFNQNGILSDELSDSFCVAYHDTHCIKDLFNSSGLSINKQYGNYNFSKLEDEVISSDKIYILS